MCCTEIIILNFCILEKGIKNEIRKRDKISNLKDNLTETIVENKIEIF